MKNFKASFFLSLFFFLSTLNAQTQRFTSSSQNKIDYRINNRFEIDLDSLSQINSLPETTQLEDVVDSLKMYFTTTSFFYRFTSEPLKNPYTHENSLTQMKVEGTPSLLLMRALSHIYREDLTTFNDLVFRTFSKKSFAETSARKNKVYNCFVSDALSLNPQNCFEKLWELTVLDKEYFGKLKAAYSRLLRLGKLVFVFDYEQDSKDEVIVENCAQVNQIQRELRSALDRTRPDSSEGEFNSVHKLASLPGLGALAGPVFAHSKLGYQYLCKNHLNPFLN
jgi:hypothetical protein